LYDSSALHLERFDPSNRRAN